MNAGQIKHRSIQALRRCVQLSVVGLMVSLALLSLYAHYRAARAFDDEQFTAGWKGKALLNMDRHVSALEDPQTFLDGFKGTLWSMRLGGIDLTDPLAAAEMLATSKTVYWPLIAGIVIPVIVTLLLGKVFCSWVCPANLLFEITGKLRKLLRFAEIPPAQMKFSRKNKYMLLAIGLVVAGVTALPMFVLIYPPAVLSRLAHAWIFGTAMTGMFILIGAAITFELFVSPRWWCRSMCPGGALYGLIGYPRLLRVKLDASRCTGCGECEPACEPGLNPVLESYGIECDNCGACIRHCPERALYYTIGLPARHRPNHAAKNAPTKRQPIVAAAIVLVGILSIPANGHHILGLPHYSYKENYPQAPTLEYPATTGPYHVLLTSYPGKPVPSEPANLAFYIKNQKTGRPYDRPITARVLQTFTFGRNRVILAPTVIEPFEVPHKISVTFPEDGEYAVELTMDVEGKPETIPFVMVAGNPSATASVLIAILAGLGIFIIVVRAIKIKRQRRSSAKIAKSPVPAAFATGAD